VTQHRLGWAIIVCLLAAVVVGVAWAAVMTNGRERMVLPKYEWLAGNSAPSLCPMEIAAGAFLYRGGGSLYIPPGELSPKWGETASIHVVGPDLKPLPDRLQITFYSFLEDKIYKGDFELPYERIAKLFSVGYYNPDPAVKAMITYDEIVAGVAPGGAVAVWVSGQMRAREVFFGHAQALALDWNATLQFPPTALRADIRAEVLKEAVGKKGSRALQFQQHIPFGMWERFRKRYAWRPVFENMPMPKEVTPIEYYNGEVDYFLFPQSDADMHALRATPSRLVYRMAISGQTRLWRHEVLFDEEETLSAFERIGSDERPFELVFRQEDEQTEDTVWVRSGEESIRLSKATVE
jgi:hypothetical protein